MNHFILNRFFNVLIVAFSIILCFFSLTAFVFVHIELSQKEFQVNLEGINNYFIALSQFKELFAGTITLIVAFYGLQRLKAADTANSNKIKTDRFLDWKTIMDCRLKEVEKNDVFIREFSRLRYNFYNELYERKMSISNKNELLEVYNKYFQSDTRLWEESHRDYHGMGGVYRNTDSSYFFNDFYFVFIGCLDKSYDGIHTDLKNIYIQNIDPDREIDEKIYEEAFTRFTGII